MIRGVTPWVPMVSAMVRRRAEMLGPAGELWLSGLGDLIGQLRREWSFEVVEPLGDGFASYVVRVRTVGGRDAVLKVQVPGQGFAGQVRTLRDAKGRGYARVLAHDVERNAVLLEALGPSMDRLALSPERAIEALCRTLRQAWRVPRPAGATVAPAEEKATRLGHMVARLWRQLDQPCSERVVDRALRYAERRAAAFELERCVVVHGDPHPGNALRVPAPRAGAESGFVFVDPDGFLADPTYDLGVVIRDWNPRLLAGDAASLARRYCRLLADHTGLDQRAIWEWGYLERVSTGLYILEHGAEDLARPYLETAERLL
jgi:streptomycin 6-kinase